MSSTAKGPPVGAHLVSPRGIYDHHGIYVGRGQVVHYSGKSVGVQSGPVCLASLKEFCAGRGYAIWPHPLALHPPREVVRRARSRLGENLYRLTSNNCEHFCEWCLNGNARSHQVEATIAGATHGGSTTLPLVTTGPRLLLPLLPRAAGGVLPIALSPWLVVPMAVIGGAYVGLQLARKRRGRPKKS
jgi:hypothetical protein